MPRDAGRAVVVRDHVGAKAEAVVRLAEAGIAGPPGAVIDRPAMAIGRIEVAQRVERQPERIDLSVGEVLGMRAVGPHPVGVARVHGDWADGRLPCDLRVVGKAVAGIDPAVEAPGKTVGHAVRVASAEGAVHDFAVVGPAVAVVSRIR